MVRDSIFIGKTIENKHEYFVQNRCIGCKLCYSVCPHITQKLVINQHLKEICSKQCIDYCKKVRIGVLTFKYSFEVSTNG